MGTRRLPRTATFPAVDLREVENLAARGLTRTQIAAFLGVSYRTLQRRCQDSRELERAIRKGEAKGMAIIANVLLEAARDGNVAAQIFLLQSRGGLPDPNAEDKDAEDATESPADDRQSSNSTAARLRKRMARYDALLTAKELAMNGGVPSEEPAPYIRILGGYDRRLDPEP